MKTEINIEDYLSHDEIKGIAADQVRASVAALFSSEAKAIRLIINLAYEIIFDEVDKAIPNSRQVIIDKVAELVAKDSSYDFHVFRGKDTYRDASLAVRILEEAVSDNREVIRGKVLDAITNRDYTDVVWKKFEELGENFISNLYDLVALGREKSMAKNQ